MSLEFATEIHLGASFFSVRFSFKRKAGEDLNACTEKYNF